MRLADHARFIAAFLFTRNFGNIGTAQASATRALLDYLFLLQTNAENLTKLACEVYTKKPRRRQPHEITN